MNEKQLDGQEDREEDQKATEAEGTANTKQTEASQPEEELTPEQINWRKFREQRAREREEAKQAQERERQEREAKETLQKYISETLSAQGMQGQMTPAQQEQMIADLADDEIPTGREIKGYLEREVERRVKAIIQSSTAEQEKRSMPQRIQTQLKDFDRVCSQENLDYLQYKAPYLAESLSSRLADTQNIRFEDLAALYDAVLQVVPQASEKRTPAQQADVEKPRSLSHPVANVSRDMAPRSLTAEQREQEYQRMVAASKGLG